MRGYYGTLSHNAKAVYQRYLGWYDANPANLNPLPPVERGRKYVEYMGGADAVIARAREDFAKGEYRFVAEAMSHVVFADPRTRRPARLGADALEQLGYAAESATWRNAYLLGARELRQGPTGAGGARRARAPTSSAAMSLDLFFDYLGVRLNGDKAEGKTIVVNWVFPDLGRRYVLTLQNCALTYLADRQSERARRHRDARRAVLNRLILRELTIAEAVEQGLVSIEGDRRQGRRAVRLLDDFALMFERGRAAALRRKGSLLAQRAREEPAHEVALEAPRSGWAAGSPESTRRRCLPTAPRRRRGRARAPPARCGSPPWR